MVNYAFTELFIIYSLLLNLTINIPYPLEYNHGVVFFNMSFWVRFNSKNPSKRGLFDQKMGFYSRKSPKTGLLKRGEVIFKSGAVLERIRYSIYQALALLANFF